MKTDELNKDFTIITVQKKINTDLFKNEYLEFIKKEMSQQLGELLYENKFIEISEEEDLGEKRITMRIKIKTT